MFFQLKGNKTLLKKKYAFSDFVVKLGKYIYRLGLNLPLPSPLIYFSIKCSVCSSMKKIISSAEVIALAIFNFKV